MDLRSPNRFGPIFVKAGQQAGYPLNTDFNGAEQEGVGLYQVTHRNGERFSAAKAYLTPHLGRPNLQVITGAQVPAHPLRGPARHRRRGARRRPLQKLQARREVLLAPARCSRRSC
jgi:choline dehydrogenase-like flavoprotein